MDTDYRRNYFQRFWPEFWRLGREHRKRAVIAVFAAFGAAVLQWVLIGSIPEGFWVRGLIIVGPHVVILAVLLVWTLSDTAVELDTKRRNDLADRDARIIALEVAQAEPPLKASERRRLEVVAEVFGGCGVDALRILGLIASGPLPTFTPMKESGAEDFNQCIGKAQMKGVIRVERDGRGHNHYLVPNDWKAAVEHFLNERLA